jgi:cytoskeleton protein RodZ
VSIEADSPDGLPGVFFYRAFVRQYANHLGLVSAELEAQLDRTVPPPPAVPDAADVTEDRRPDVAPITSSLPAGPFRERSPLGLQIGILVSVIVACAGLYAWWDRMQNAPVNSAAHNEAVLSSKAAEGHTPPPAAVVAPESQTASQQSAQQSPAPGGQALSGAQTPGAQPGSVSSPSPGLEAGSAPVPTPQQQSTAPPVSATPQNGEGRPLVLSATRDVWLTVTAEGKKVFNGILKAGDSRTLGIRDNGRVLVGNAGSLNMSWNGAPVAIGSAGQVRTVLLTPERASVLTSAPVKDEP